MSPTATLTVEQVAADLDRLGIPRPLTFKASPAVAAPPTITSVKADGDEGIVRAIVSVTGVEDEVRDIILPGAYRDTLTKRNPKVCWHHAWEKPVGRVLTADEWLPGDARLPKTTKDGKPWPKAAGALVLEMKFNLASERGREAFEAVKFYSESNECEWSIGYNVPPGASTKDRAGRRLIKSLDLWEASFVLFGAAPLSMTLDMKSAVDAWRTHTAVAGPDDTVGVAEVEVDVKALHEAAAPLLNWDLIRAAGASAVKSGVVVMPTLIRDDVDQRPEVDRKVTAAERLAAAKSGAAMSDGSYPIESEHDLRAALAWVEAKGVTDVAVRGHVFSRAVALNRLDLITKGAAREDKPTLPGEGDRYPIGNREDLSNAVQAFGRAKDTDKDRVKRWIIRRARELNAMDVLPESWKANGKALPLDSDTDITATCPGCSQEVVFDTLDGWQAKDGSISHETDSSTHSMFLPVPEQYAEAKAGGADRNRGGAENLRNDYLHGKTAAKIRWGTDGDGERCHSIAAKHMTSDQAWGYCFTGDTEFLTRDGVMTFADAADTEQMVLTQADPTSQPGAAPVRKDGRWVQAPIKSYGEQRVLNVTMTRNKITKTIRATPEHEWFASTDGRTSNRDRVKAFTTAELQPGMALAALLPKPTSPRTHASPFGVAAGFVFGDGHREGNRGARVDLWGEKDQALLPYFAGCQMHPVKTQGGVLGTRVSGIPASWKGAPSLDEGVSFLFGWLAGYLAADGTVTQGGQVVLYSASREHLELAATVGHRLGISTSGISSNSRVGYGAEPSELFRLGFIGETVPESLLVIPEHRQRFAAATAARTQSPVRWRIVSVEDLGEAEEVFCAEVPDTATFALTDQVWVHNCQLRHIEATGSPMGKGHGTKSDAADVEVKGAEPMIGKGVMVSLPVSADVADTLAMDGGNPPSEMHVTLAFLGDSADLTDEQRVTLAEVVEAVAGRSPALSGKVGGVGWFPDSGSGVPAWVPVDVPSMGAMREALVAALTAAGLPVSMDHGFAPHITLGYDMDGAKPVPSTEIGFDAVEVVDGDTHTRFPLGAKRVEYDPALDTAPAEVKMRRGEIEGSYQERIHAVDAAASDAFLDTNEDGNRAGVGWIDVTAVWADRAVIGVYSEGPSTDVVWWEVDYTFEDGVATFVGDPRKVKVRTTIEDDDTDEDDSPAGRYAESLMAEVVSVLASAAGPEAKAGRVLSGANSGRLQAAVQTLLTVLAAAGVEVIAPSKEQVKDEQELDDTHGTSWAPTPDTTSVPATRPTSMKSADGSDVIVFDPAEHKAMMERMGLG